MKLNPAVPKQIRRMLRFMLDQSGLTRQQFAIKMNQGPKMGRGEFGAKMVSQYTSESRHSKTPKLDTIRRWAKVCGFELEMRIVRRLKVELEMKTVRRRK